MRMQANEVLRDGLRLLEQRDAEDTARIIGLRQAVATELNDIDSGYFREFADFPTLANYLAELSEQALKDR
ncbi:MAG: hypothetical protein ACKVVP_22455 [Chloroflexota bacterium]